MLNSGFTSTNTVGESGGQVAGDLVELFLRHQRSELGGGVDSGADLDLAGGFGDRGGEVVEDAVLNEHSGAGNAGLAVVEQPSIERSSDGSVEVSIREHDVGALAAEFERRLLEIAPGGVDDLLPDLGGAGERDLVDVVVGRQCRSCGAVAGDDVDDAGREACLLEHLAEQDSGKRVCSAGLMITVLPAASAGASLNAAMRSGRVQEMIRPQTPTGSRSVYA